MNDQQRRVLDQIWAARLRLEQDRHRLDELIHEAARLGTSWQRIAAMTQIRPEALQERYQTHRRAPSKPDGLPASRQPALDDLAAPGDPLSS